MTRFSVKYLLEALFPSLQTDFEDVLDLQFLRQNDDLIGSYRKQSKALK